MQEVKVLDHGYVRLVDSMGSDLSIARAARVSYDASWRDNAGAGDNITGDEKLIHYLMQNRHTSPFESVTFTFEVSAPIFVLRQWHRHRTWSYNEISARYTELPETFYIPDAEQVTTQHSSNKQMRTSEQHPKAEELRMAMMQSMQSAFHTYKALIAEGCPRELARSVLPCGTYSRMFATVDLHNLLHFIGLRSHAHAQYEIRVYSDAILQLIAPVVPVTVSAWEKYYGKK